jgi:CDP-diglyceride synthetase
MVPRDYTDFMGFLFLGQLILCFVCIFPGNQTWTKVEECQQMATFAIPVALFSGLVCVWSWRQKLPCARRDNVDASCEYPMFVCASLYLVYRGTEAIYSQDAKSCSTIFYPYFFCVVSTCITAAHLVLVVLLSNIRQCMSHRQSQMGQPLLVNIV